MSVAAIAALAKTVDERGLSGMGRTALMKFAYLLQTIRNVPLGYDFRLYTYGPYDADVLEELKVAELKGAVETISYHHPNGMGYLIKPGPNCDKVLTGGSEVEQHRGDFSWVIEKFGTRSAVELEMISTIIFVDRTFAERGESVALEAIASRVREIKPRLDLAKITREACQLKTEGFLTTAIATA